MTKARSTLVAAPGSFTSMRAGFVEMFSADARSLALARIGIAATLLVDLAWRSTDLRAFYSDSGVMPRGQWLETFRNSWSLYLFSGSPRWITALLVVHALVAVAMLVGYRTRLATLAAWVLTASLHSRNPTILQGADTLLLLLLFWCFFAPTGARFSIDARRSKAPKPVTVLSAGTVGLFLQMPLVYLSASLQKSGPEWRKNFDAVYLALNDDFISSRFGRMLGAAPMSLLKGITVATLVLELAIPVLLFFPMKTHRARIVALAVAISLQVGFGICFSIGLFPVVSSVALFVFLPPDAWTWLAARPSIARLRAALTARLERGRIQRLLDFAASLSSAPAEPSPRRALLERRVLAVAGASFVALSIWCNLVGLDLVKMPDAVRQATGIIHFGQAWKMFIHPNKSRGWFVATGDLGHGELVDVGHDDVSAVHWDKPEVVSQSFGNYRWRKYFSNVRDKELVAQRPAFARYMCNQWNERHPSAKVKRIALYYLSELTGVADAETKKQKVFDLSCANTKPAKEKAPVAPAEAPRAEVSASSPGYLATNTAAR